MSAQAQRQENEVEEDESTCVSAVPCLGFLKRSRQLQQLENFLDDGEA
jgi:hypothetical protein